MKKYLLHLAYGLAGIGAFLAGPAHAVIAGGMAANHYYYPASTVANADGLYGYNGIDASIRVTHEPGNNGNTFYATQFFWTVNVNQGGYAGIQQNSKKTKTVLFSIFGQTYDSNVDKPGSAPGAVCRAFGGEGTGTQCLFTTKGSKEPAWRGGTRYTLHVEYTGKTTIPAGAADAGENYLWQASITDEDMGTTTVIGTIHSPAGNGLLQAVVPQFVENFTQGSQQYSSCSQVPPTTAVFYAPVMYDPAGNAVQTNNASTETYGDCASIASSMMNPDKTAIATINQPPGAPFIARNRVQHYCADTLGGNHLGLNICAGSDSSSWAVGNQLLANDVGNRLNLIDRNVCLQANGSSAVLAASCTADSSQEWLYMPGSEAWLNVGSDQCLNAAGDAGQNSTVNLADCDSSDYQQWIPRQP
ncbi:RICIN domain-containing protein [Rhodanobacter sp. IGA1.0]|uniref:RICIN domain-containing protein n=1 Tax=Rhodanobacter sp. IGA1.0 TaxID=3158582 RepID=A0AAU7QHB6_9GAMM